jgi:hypothetical protein
MSQKIVLEFIEAINHHDVDAIYDLMADDHKFIDAHGNEVSGNDIMKAGWAGYFSIFPDYLIEITDIFMKPEHIAMGTGKAKLPVKLAYYRNDFIVAFGFASGTYKGIKTDDNKNHFRIPACWKAIIKGGKIQLWQVYCDTKKPFDLIEREENM